MAQLVKNLPTMRETWVQSLGWEDLLEKKIPTHSSDLYSILAWEISWTENSKGFPCGSAGKESAHNAGDLVSIPGLGRSPGEGEGYLL